MAAERTLRIMVEAGGAAFGSSSGSVSTGSTNGGGGGRTQKDDFNSLRKATDKLYTEFKTKVPPLDRVFRKMGIEVGFKSILKQSQIFTGVVGSIFQILGALVDVTLAPFLPVIVPAIRNLGKLIPKWRKQMESWMGGINNFLGFIKGAWDTLKSTVEKVIGRKLGFMGQTLLAILAILALKKGMGLLMKGMSKGMGKGLGKFGPGFLKNTDATAKATTQVAANTAKTNRGIGSLLRAMTGKKGRIIGAGVGLGAGLLTMAKLKGDTPKTPGIPDKPGPINLADPVAKVIASSPDVKTGAASKAADAAKVGKLKNIITPLTEVYASMGKEVGKITAAAGNNKITKTVLDMPKNLGVFYDESLEMIGKSSGAKVYKTASKVLKGGAKATSTLAKGLFNSYDDLAGMNASTPSVKQGKYATRSLASIYGIEDVQGMGQWDSNTSFASKTKKKVFDVMENFGFGGSPDVPSGNATNAAYKKSKMPKLASKPWSTAVDVGKKPFTAKVPLPKSATKPLAKLGLKGSKGVPLIGLIAEVVDAGLDAHFNYNASLDKWSDSNPLKKHALATGVTTLGLGMDAITGIASEFDPTFVTMLGLQEAGQMGINKITGQPTLANTIPGYAKELSDTEQGKSIISNVKSKVNKAKSFMKNLNPITKNTGPKANVIKPPVSGSGFAGDYETSLAESGGGPPPAKIEVTIKDTSKNSTVVASTAILPSASMNWSGYDGGWDAEMYF